MPMRGLWTNGVRKLAFQQGRSSRTTWPKRDVPMQLHVDFTVSCGTELNRQREQRAWAPNSFWTGAAKGGYEQVNRGDTAGTTAETAGHSTHCMLHTLPGWTVLSRPGLASDAEAAALTACAEDRVHLRLGLGELAQPCRCCLSAPAALVAVDSDDPSLPEGLGRALRDGGRGVALATVGAEHLAGTHLVTETSTLAVAAAGVDAGEAVVLHLADAAALLADNPDVVTVAVLRLRPGAVLPPAWRLEADRTQQIAQGLLPSAVA